MRGCETDVFTDSGVLDDMLRCPCELHHEVSVDRATATITCTYARCHLVGRTFPIIDGQPVLVDFRNSVLDEATTIDRGAPTLIGRSSGWRHTLARMVFGDKPMARRNAARFLHELKSRVRRPVVLVVGGGAMGDGAEALYQDPDIRLIAFDIYRSDLTHFIADAHSIPLAEETIDGVWIQAVLEHVLSPERVVAEIFRVLRPGGLVYAETPFMQQVHEGAYDFTRFTESGHRWLFRRFALIDSGLERGPFSVLLWSIRYALTGLTRSRLLATLICTLLFWLRYFDHLVPVLSPADVVRAYGGARHRGDHTPRGVSTVKSPRLSTAPLGLTPDLPAIIPGCLVHRASGAGAAPEQCAFLQLLRTKPTMCGLAGLIATPGTYGGTELAQAVHRMTSVLWHRGPDSCGTWIDPQTGVALGHRRLAIIDLSEEGHQPMVSETGRFVIIFNGEIYNFRSIRRELTELGWHFRGHSDTEVLLAAIEQWGLEVTLPKLAGMFAFAVWNRESRILHLVRDRIGKKPLYLGWANREFVFASELKAFREHSSFVPAVNRDALVSLLRFGYVPAPHTIYQDVFKLLPGSCLSLPLATIGSARDDVLERMRRYWSAAEVAERGVAAPLALSAAEAVDQLDRLLSQATAERMIADVPLGALLSGGVDSSTVVALMQKQSTRPIKTFSVGFHEAGYDEAIDAERVAGHLGTDHTQLYVTPTEAQAVIPRLPEIYDEPFADQSQIPTFLVSQLARRQVTVALSGDGGDEVFGGYNRYFLAPWLWRRMRACPWAIRRGVANVFTMLSSDSRGVLARRMDRLLPRGTRLPAPGYHLNKFASILAVQGPDDLYLNVISRWHQPTAAILAGSDPAVAAGAGISLDDLTDRAMYYDTVGYLPDDILVKVDRASMAVSLEVRAPLLDHRVVEFAWRLPRAMKLRGRQGKWVLRQLLYRYVPRDLVDRPKQGFDVPVDDWLRAPLRDWAEEMLASARLAAEGFFDPRPIRDLWSEHLAGKRNGGDCLWPILMFQAWQERWLGPRASKPASGAALHATAASC